VSDQSNAADREFLGLTADRSGLAGTVDITSKLMSPRGSFYGGAGLALACAMMEQATQRATVWCTVQFASGAGHGDRLELDTDVVAHGHRTSQVRVTARVDGREVFTSVGATGAAGGRSTKTFASMPPVSPPEASARHPWPDAVEREKTHFGTTEIREAVVHGATEGSATPSMALWARVDGTPAWTPTLLAYVADVVPMSIHRALGTRQPGGMSLDNSLRVGPPVEAEWLLLALHAEATNEGYGHGSVHLWSPDGVLAGVASQTFALRSA
jgi:acyl-CoA thioesterase